MATASQIPVLIRTRSPSPSPTKSPSGKADPIFFHSSNKTIRSPSPSIKNNISIKIDPAEEDSDHRRDSDIILADSTKFQSTFILRSREYDRELIRRQQVLIALQPTTVNEKIEEKRRLLQIKVENRKRVDALVASRASTSLGNLSMTDQHNIIRRSPSPSPSISPKPDTYKKQQYKAIVKLAESTTQAAKVTKKVIPKPTAIKTNKSKK